MYTEVMIDLETMDVGPNAAIVAIGAVAFNRDDIGIIEENPTFYTTIDLTSAMAYGGTVSGDTVLWWLKQEEAAREQLYRESNETLMNTLMGFKEWLTLYCDTQNVKIWGNGANFDNVILANAYRNCNMQPPWNFWNDRCYRTLKAENPNVIPASFNGVQHNALHDAVNQAQHALGIMNPSILLP